MKWLKRTIIHNEYQTVLREYGMRVDSLKTAV